MADFNPFATGASAKVLPLRAYIEDDHSYRTEGLVPDTIALAMIWNRAIRQASMLTSALSSVAATAGETFTDDGDLESLTEALQNTLEYVMEHPVVSLGSHNEMLNRDASAQHPMSSITGLSTALAAAINSIAKTTTVDSNSTDSQVPSALAAKTYLEANDPSPAFADITGTITNQSDLIAAFPTKLMISNTEVSHFLYAENAVTALTVSASYPAALVIYPAS